MADLEVLSDEDCLAVVRKYLSFFPSHNREAPPVVPCSDPVDRHVEELYKIVPTAPRRAYDMVKVVQAVVDDGDFFPMKPGFARNLVTGLARVGGMPVGIVANQPMVLGGALDVNAADKAARFVWLCDAFGIPLVFLHDVPGFIVGSAVEKQGIIRHGAKMLFAVSEATVPKVSVVLRKGYGGLLRDERHGLRGRLRGRVAHGRDRRDGSRRDGGDQPPQGARPARGQGPRRPQDRAGRDLSQGIDPYIAAGGAQVDDVIDPAGTRWAIWKGLQVSKTKHIEPALAQARRPARLTPSDASRPVWTLGRMPHVRLVNGGVETRRRARSVPWRGRR